MTDEYRYYSHEWVVDIEAMAFVVHQLLSNPQKMDYELRVEPQTQQNSEGYYCVKFLIRVGGNAVLLDFVERLGKRIGLTNWQSIAETDFSNCFDFMAIEYGLIQSNYIDGLLTWGVVNSQTRATKDR